MLVAEELFACGCCFLISMTSAGQIALDGRPIMVIARALRDEGTSYHYSPPSYFAEADPKFIALAVNALKQQGLSTLAGTTWTTDAPFRETAAAIDAARKQGIRAVEMEAAALYAFARARSAAVLCLAHVTNTMGQNEQDFEKGELDGAASALAILEAIVKAVRAASSPMRTG